MAGLAADFLSQGTLSQDVPQKLYSRAYARESPGPPVAWNGVDWKAPRGLINGLEGNSRQALRQTS